jgi:hypothetical protein
MIIPALHRQIRPVDSQSDRRLAVRLPVPSWAHLGSTNALFLSAAECLHAACDYPIVFVKAGEDGQGGSDYAPIAVLGLAAGENLYLEGGQWRVHQLPTLLASYPFAIARGQGENGQGGQFAVCIDAAYEGLSQGGEGERLFDEAGQTTEFARRVAPARRPEAAGGAPLRRCPARRQQDQRRRLLRRRRGQGQGAARRHAA